MSDEGIIHYGAVKVRVNGMGNLVPTFSNLDGTKIQIMPSFVMSGMPGLEPIKLVSFKTQRAFLRLGTSQLNEIFKINRVIVYVKPLWSQYAGQ
jgi:hypothetical protein